MRSMPLLLIVVLLCFDGVFCACAYGTSDPVSNFIIMSPDQYDRNYSDITSAISRPLGYAVGRVLYNSLSPDPCVRLCGTGSGSYVEVKTETSLQSSLCFQEAQAVDENCQVAGDINACQPYTAARDGCSYFRFFLNTNGQANEADVSFWYRFVISNSSNDMWCSSRNPDERPSSLLPYLPPAELPATQLSSDDAFAAAKSASQAAVLAASVAALALVR